MPSALVLALETLRASYVATAINVLLIAVSVVCVASAMNAFDGLRQVVAGIAGQGAAWEANVEVSRCARCPDLRSQSPLLQRAIVEQRVLSIQLQPSQLQPSGSPIPSRRSTKLMCVSPMRTPPEVNWRSRQLRDTWHGEAGEPVVLAGAHVPLHSTSNRSSSTPQYIRANHGTWLVAGVLRERPSLGEHAGENDALLVPFREPFSRLCAGGALLWRIVAADSVALSSAEDAVNGELRTLARLRPGEQAPWSIIRADRLARLAFKLVSRFRRWVMIAPIMVALLCGAAVFSVQALDADSRVAEFGVRRAVGATRHVMHAQLATEVGIVVGGGVAAAGVVLLLLGTGAATTVRGVSMAFMVVAPLAAIGMLAPLVEVQRSPSPAALEGRDG